MQGSRLASTKNSYWSSVALFSGPNNHALILTIACYSNFIELQRQNRNKINGLDKQINKTSTKIFVTLTRNKGSWW